MSQYIKNTSFIKFNQQTKNKLIFHIKSHSYVFHLFVFKET